MEENEAVKTVISDAKGIKTYVADIEVKPIGDGSHVVLPKELIGKTVRVCYNREGAE